MSNILQLLFAFFLIAGSHTTLADRNIVFFLVDDLGWADVGFNGSNFYETPNIDALAASGMRFNRGYAACPVCSPTRASIMTGRHPVRVDITDWIPGMKVQEPSQVRVLSVEDRDSLALEETTIAEVLKEAGYQTFFAGKWHLGKDGFWPRDQGFDFNVGGNDKGSPPGGYYAPWRNPSLVADPDIEDEYLTERLTKESISFLNARDKDRPFLLYLSYYNVHTPITPYKKTFDRFQRKATQLFTDTAKPIQEHQGLSHARQDNAAYASMISAVDQSVGALLSHLQSSGLEDETAIFFFSDNGGLCTKRTPGPTSNLPLRSGKGWLYEGGVREPTIIRVPGLTKPGSSTNVPVVSMDFFPTILDLAGLEPRPDLHADGVSLISLMEGQPWSNDRALYWHYPHHHGSTWTPGASILDGPWKLIEFYEWDKVELYHLDNDPGEHTDLSHSESAKREELRTKLKRWQIQMKAKMPPVRRATLD